MPTVGELAKKFEVDWIFDEKNLVLSPKMNAFIEAIISEYVTLTTKECIGIILQEKDTIAEIRVFNSHDEFWNRARIQQCQHLADLIAKNYKGESTV